MKTINFRVGLCAALVLTLCACDQNRKRTETTGTATATVKTEAAPNVISNSQLQQAAQTAADKASIPVVNTMSNTTQ